MKNYPDVVATLVNDYLQRVKTQLHVIPAREQDEFLREIHSHIYEAYHQVPCDDEVAAILAVFRNLGEPAEVVSDRLPAAMVRSGTRRNLPLHLLGGMLIAVFGIPLGFGGVAVLTGVLFSLAGVVVAYYAAVGASLLAGAMFAVFGLTRIYRPELWDKLITLGIIQMDEQAAQFLQQISAPAQGILMLVLAAALIAIGLGMLHLGRYLVRGLRFLFNLAFDWLRQLAQGLRRKVNQDKREAFPMGEASFVK